MVATSDATVRSLEDVAVQLRAIRHQLAAILSKEVRSLNEEIDFFIQSQDALMAVPVRNPRRRAAQCAGADAWAHCQDARGAMRALSPGLHGEALEGLPALHRLVTSASTAAQPDAVEDRDRRSVMAREPLIFK